MPQTPTYAQLQARIEELERERQEYRQIKDELVKRQKYLESVLHYAPDAIVTLNEMHRVLEWNPGAERTFGYTREEALGRDVDNLICRSDILDEAQEITRRVLSGGPFIARKLTRFTKDGTPVQVIGTGAPIFIDGVLKGIVAVYTDITNQQEMEKALLESEYKYRTIFENTGTATIIIEEDTTISLVNKEFEALSGYSRQEIEGQRSWKDFIASSDDLKKMEKYHQLRRQDPNAAPNTYEARFMDKDSTLKHVILTVDVIPGTQQSVASFLDISDYMTLQENLQQERDFLDKILENSADAIAIVDEHGRFTRWNKRAAELFGYNYREMRSQRAFSFYPDQAEMENMLAILRRDGQVRNYEISYQGKDGNAIPCSVSIAIIKDITGKNIGSVSIVRDLTEWKKMHEKLKHMSFHDSLTGLYNRNFFEEEMDRLQDGRYIPLGIIVCDVDGLKIVNDSFGHERGDTLLANTANILQQTFRSSDIIARIGGDEFAVLVTQTQPCDIADMVQRLRNNVEKYNSRNPMHCISLSIGYTVSEKQPIDMQELFREADQQMYREKIQRDKSSRSDIVKVLLKALEARDFVTEGHCGRLQTLILPLAHRKGITKEILNDILLLAKFHDVGKLGIPDSILFKPGPLNRTEMDEMRRHPEIGHRIAQAVSELAPIADWILRHHEWWNGQGYPLGLQGEEIPLPCRILAIADAYDAMTTDRPYRKAMSHQDAVLELKRNAGSQFDPQLVHLFIQLIEKVTAATSR